jgi:N-methylhydantoinase A/oxoprolinase/acetone carboxylase beta subunit
MAASHHISQPVHLGIDTGGTFTDGVLFNPRQRSVIRKAKVLTTHEDLTVCIANVLEALLGQDDVAIELVSLSTTLATNAIAEGKRKPVALLLLGYDPQLVYQYHFDKEFGTSHFFFIQGRHGLNGVEQIPLDEAEIGRVAVEIKDEVDAFAICSYAGFGNSDHEERAARIVAALTGLPVVQAHHLSSELDSIRRAITASLNASLLAPLKDFLDAIETIFAQRGIHCPIMVVRGDGSTVRASFARGRPVEMIHSGPATSSIGGHFLAGVDNALVIDVGGTTTDIALIQQGLTQVEQGGATVGPYRTCVNTIKVRSLGLGGDSHLQFDTHQNLTIGPQRVLPLSHLCHDFPALHDDLLARLRGPLFSRGLEYWILQRLPRRPFKSARTNRLIELLQKGPQPAVKLFKAVGVVSAVQVDIDELLNQEIILRAGFTPTDLLHVSGEFAPWDVEIAHKVTQWVAGFWEEDEEAFIRRVKEQFSRKIVVEIIQLLSGRVLSEPEVGVNGKGLDRWLLEENLSASNPFFGSRLFLKVPIVGIGAPVKAFLPQVAQALGTEIVFPANFEVANAVGAAVGHVIIRHEGEIYPCVEGSTITGYFARVAGTLQKFRQYQEALAFAKECLTSTINEESLAAGGNHAKVEIEVKSVIEGMAHLHGWSIS